MCANSEQYETVCKGEFASIHVKLDKMDEAIRGNGKPGIQLRLDRLENSESRRSRLLWLAAGAAVTLAVGAAWKAITGA
jgi:hypothetical protein